MNRKVIILISILVLILTSGFLYQKYSPQNELPKIALSPSINISPKLSPSPTSTLPTPEPSPTFREVPKSYIIDNFPFQSQAPFANWDQLHNEACEEASVALVNFWLNNKSSISAEQMENEIQKMVSWQNENWGGHHDLTIKQTGQMAKAVYGLKITSLDYDISLDDIKKEVSLNHPVIVPTAGRLLGNPNFRSPGPVYHMVVVIGYNENQIIVQDVGTRNGNHYKYYQNVFLNAIHDWAGSPENIEQGQKAMLVLQ